MACAGRYEKEQGKASWHLTVIARCGSIAKQFASDRHNVLYSGWPVLRYPPLNVLDRNGGKEAVWLSKLVTRCRHSRKMELPPLQRYSFCDQSKLSHCHVPRRLLVG